MPKLKRDMNPPGSVKLGLVCRVCGCQHFRVVYLRRRPNGIVLRRRECRHCGRRITTRETSV